MIKIGITKDPIVLKGDVIQTNYNRKAIRLLVEVLGNLNNWPDGDKRQHICEIQFYHNKKTKISYYHCSTCDFRGKKMTIKQIKAYEYQREFDMCKINSLKILEWVKTGKVKIIEDANKIHYWIDRITNFLEGLTGELNAYYDEVPKLTAKHWDQINSYYTLLWDLNKKVEVFTSGELEGESINWQFELIHQRVINRNGLWGWRWENGKQLIYLREQITPRK